MSGSSERADVQEGDRGDSSGVRGEGDRAGDERVSGSVGQPGRRVLLCSTLGHEERAATHRVTWTRYGGGIASRLLCESCAANALGRGTQRGVRIETLPTFRGVGQ